MGLDMYLKKRTYIGAEYEHNKIEGVIYITEKGKQVQINFKRVQYIIENMGYWRKANHIHKWFVGNVQGGEDDCEDYPVSKEQFEKLLADCKAIKESKDKAPEILPTQSGFFFGGTEYDEWYWKNIDYTIEVIETILKEDPQFMCEYYYSSSW
jgi:hypothetical protein